MGWMKKWCWSLTESLRILDLTDVALVSDDTFWIFSRGDWWSEEDDEDDGEKMIYVEWKDYEAYEDYEDNKNYLVIKDMTW